MHPFFLAFLFFILPFSIFGTQEEGNPLIKTKKWFEEEKQRSERGFRRFATLSTVGQDGHPYSRMIEIVGMSSKNGILFFTHRQSQKVEHFLFTPFAALNIWLPKTLRQISINGDVKEVPRESAEKTWKRMPRFMKFTFLSSQQKGSLPSPTILEERQAKLEEMYKDREIPMPEAFVGYRLTPKRAVFYEIKPRRFPECTLVELEKGHWNICYLEP